MSNPAGKAPPISIGTGIADFGRKSDAKRYMHSIAEEPEENDKSRSKQADTTGKAGPPVPHPIRPPFQQQPNYGSTALYQAPVVTTSNFMPEKTGSGFSSGFQPPGITRKLTGDTSQLNQSLNSSIRVQKAVLQKMDQSIADGKHLDESSVIELNIDDNGFLIDAQGFPILNDRGEPMKLTDDNIDFLKENGLYEEADVEDGGN
jgi:hypothetical protein